MNLLQNLSRSGGGGFRRSCGHLACKKAPFLSTGLRAQVAVRPNTTKLALGWIPQANSASALREFHKRAPSSSSIGEGENDQATAEELEQQYIVATYGKQGVRSKKGLVLDHGEGAVVYDTNGNKYIDFAAGIAVSVLGHGNKEISAAVCDQIGKLAHSSNMYHTQPPLRVAKKLIELSPGFEKVFFTNSGTEANEGAIKFARLYSNEVHRNNNERTKIIAFQGSFHGRSLGSLSLTYKPKIRTPFKPFLMQNVVHLPFNDVESLEKEMGDDVLAVFLEPVQGEGGINPAEVEFMTKARELCDKYSSLLVFDEVQIGLGRSGSGHVWAYEHYDVVPDILTAAKPLAAGLPMGAILLSSNFMFNILKPDAFVGLHGSTFAGNPVAASAAEVVLNKLADQEFMKRVSDSGELFIKELSKLPKKYPRLIKKLNRPHGDKALYAGIHCRSSVDGVAFGVDKIISKCIDKGVLVISAGDKNDIIRVCPPLVVTNEQIQRAINVIDESFAELEKELKNTPVKLRYVEEKIAFKDKTEHDAFVKQNSILPKGFKIGSTSFEFLPKELGDQNKKKYKMNMSLVKLDEASDSYGALFTKNNFPGAPVRVGREIIAARRSISAIVVNNKISNVSPKEGGVNDALKLCEAIKTELNLDEKSAVFPSSTGIIGWRLPINEMIQNVKGCRSSLDGAGGFDFANKIMTTDNYPKARTVELHSADGSKHIGRITGFAKGAGMIEPNMATMLVFILTDVDVTGFTQDLQYHLTNAVNSPGSFNKISIDSDQSTSDTVLLISSNASKVETYANDDVDAPKGSLKINDVESQFAQGLERVCKELAAEIVRNGEGVEHVMHVRVKNAKSVKIADGVGKKIVNSPLIKTAIAGNDANVGRIVAAIGNYFSDINTAATAIERMNKRICIKVGGLTVFEKGEFQLDGEKETKLLEYIKDAKYTLKGKYPPHKKYVDIEVDFRDGDYASEVIGADLTKDYVDENAGYRS